jgi:probable F420-dependent oxidoreductase
VKLDSMASAGLEEMAGLAAGLESLGYDGLWAAETRHDPFLGLAAASQTTTRILLGTSIATAFTRSPMITALQAWDLQRASGGRFVLGLGTQVRAHNARRFSVPHDAPAARLRELVAALRHIWGAFQGEHPLRFRGRFYRHDLLTPFFDPGPIEHPGIPVYLAAVGPTMYRICGQIADGIHVHPFHTVRYLREVALPALGPRRAELTLVGSAFAVVGGDDRFVRSQIAFYGSTPTYRPVFEAHGRGDLSDRLHRLLRRGDTEAMAAAIDDELLQEFAVAAGSWSEAAVEIRRRYEGLLDRVGLYARGREAAAGSAEIVRGFEAAPAL